MKPRYLFLIVIFVICVRISAQGMPDDYRVPVMHLVVRPQPVHVQSYSRHLQETTVDFAGTALMPKAHGTAKVEATRGGLKVEFHSEGLGPAPQLDPACLTYVLWAVPTKATRKIWESWC
jgi:hypothetical protein